VERGDPSDEDRPGRHPKVVGAAHNHGVHGRDRTRILDRGIEFQRAAGPQNATSLAGNALAIDHDCYLSN